MLCLLLNEWMKLINENCWAWDCVEIEGVPDLLTRYLRIIFGFGDWDRIVEMARSLRGEESHLRGWGSYVLGSGAGPDYRVCFWMFTHL